MQDAFRVSGGKSCTQLARNLRALCRRHSSDPSQQCRKVLAIDIFHRQIQFPVGLINVVNAANIRMRNLPGQPDLIAQPRTRTVVEFVQAEKLQGDGLAELQIRRPVNLAHTATAKQADNSKAPGKQRTHPESSVVCRCTRRRCSAKWTESVRSADLRLASCADAGFGLALVPIN